MKGNESKGFQKLLLNLGNLISRDLQRKELAEHALLHSDHKEHPYFVVWDCRLYIPALFVITLTKKNSPPQSQSSPITASHPIRKLRFYTLKRQSLNFLMGMDNVRHSIKRVSKLQSWDSYSSNSQPSFSINVPEFQLSCCPVNKGNQEFSLENTASSWGNIFNVPA